MADIKLDIIQNDNQEDLENKVPSENESKKEENYGELLHNWSFLEHTEHQRSKIWYIIAGVFLVIMTIYCLNTNNILFLMIIVMSLLFIVMFKFKKPNMIEFSIFEDGIKIEETFHHWEEIREYYIIYAPDRKMKKIYFLFNKTTESSLSIDLENQNPIIIRETLNNYIQENTVRKYEHFSDQVERLLKL